MKLFALFNMRRLSEVGRNVPSYLKQSDVHKIWQSKLGLGMNERVLKRNYILKFHSTLFIHSF